jgi:hypothetical protein
MLMTSLQSVCCWEKLVFFFSPHLDDSPQVFKLARDGTCGVKLMTLKMPNAGRYIREAFSLRPIVLKA